MERQSAAGGVVIKKKDDGIKILLIKDNYGHWTWPKGHTEDGETPKETALREINEETGLKNVKILDTLGEQKYKFNLNNEEVFKTVSIFLVEFLGNEEIKIQTSEIEKGKWFSPEEALETIEYNGSRELLEKGIETFRELS